MGQATKQRRLRRAYWAKSAREYNRLMFGTWDQPSIFDRVDYTDYTANPGEARPYKDKAELADLLGVTGIRNWLTKPFETRNLTKRR